MSGEHQDLSNINELDVVALTHDIEEHGLQKGRHGAVVLVYSDGEAYEVEFVAENGYTDALLTLTSDDVVLVISWEDMMREQP